MKLSSHRTLLWEILVPVCTNEGNTIPVSFHRRWDAGVEKIAGGLTILKSTKGRWVGPDGTVFREKMIPVRIACTRAQIKEIAVMTLRVYQQQAVAFSLVSQEHYVLQ